MERKIQLSIGSIIGWYGKKYKVVQDNDSYGCERCALSDECTEIPYYCSIDGKYIHFEEIEGTK